jgi:hypothetical protein
MKLKIKIYAFLGITFVCLFFFAFSSCTGKSPMVQLNFPESPYQRVNWYHAEENTWRLTALEKGDVIIKHYNEDHEADETREIYILRFLSGEKKLVYGKGAPNRYWAPIDFGDDSTIGISKLASTRIAPYPGTDILREHEYFDYLENVYRWAMNEAGNLLLFTRNSEAEAVILIFEAIEITN